MYPLGEQFEIDYTKAVSDKKTVVQGQNYRMSVISERIVRLEFSPSGRFNDRPTQLIKKRNIGIPDFSVRQDASMMEITTKYFSLTYIKGQNTELINKAKDKNPYIKKLDDILFDYWEKEII